MKARRKVCSAIFNGTIVAANEQATRSDEPHGVLNELELRVLGELSKVRHSRLSDSVANCTKDRRSAVETGLHRMLGLGLVRQPENSKRGYKITEAGRAALLKAVSRVH